MDAPITVGDVNPARRAALSEEIMKQIAIAAAVLGLCGLSAQAAEKVKVMETVKLAAPPAKVWEKIGHFAELTWHPAIKGSEASDGDKKDSQRRLDLGGPILWENITAYDAAAHSYSYRIMDNGANQKVLPVSDYAATIKVKPDGQGSEVIWTASFKAIGDAAAAQKTISGIFRGGLDALAKDFAAK
jgi:hypothetical protein